MAKKDGEPSGRLKVIGWGNGDGEGTAGDVVVEDDAVLPIKDPESD